MYILEGCSNAYVEIISWSTDGMSIIIKKPKAFEEVISPVYFDKKCTFESFSRKLRRWGFSTRRIPRSKVEGSSTDQKEKLWVCRHPLFTRNSAFQGSNRICTSTTSKTELLGPNTSITLMADSSEPIMNRSPIIRNIPLLQRKSQHGTAVLAAHPFPLQQHASSQLSNNSMIAIEPNIDSIEAQIRQTQLQLSFEYERLLMLSKSPQSLRSVHFPQFSSAYASYNIPLEARACTPYSSLSANQSDRMISSQKYVQQRSIQEQAQDDVNTYHRVQHHQQQQQLLTSGKPSNYCHQNSVHTSSSASTTSNFRRELPVRAAKTFTTCLTRRESSSIWNKRR